MNSLKQNRPLRHIGFMVDDMKSYVETLQKIFPEMKPWTYVTCKMGPEEIIVGEPATFAIGLSEMGGVNFELVQVIDNPNVYQAKARRGIHHVSYEYAGDMEQEAKRLQNEGYVIQFAAHLKSGEKCYFLENRKDAEGIAVELNHFRRIN